VLAKADVLKGYTLTGYSGIKEEIENAGAIFVDSTVVVDRNLVSSRNPRDLDNFSITIIEALQNQ
jgi:protease I